MQLCMLLFPALSSASDVKQLMKEIVKMVNFDHPNVMTLTGVILVEGGASSPGDAIHGERDSVELCP